MQQWYTLHTKPHKERQVEAFLRGRDIEVYFPTIPIPRRPHRPSERAFFPCYLFARADLDAVGLWTLHYGPGMRGVVMFGGIPAKVDDGIIASLRARMAQVDPASGARTIAMDGYGEILAAGDRVVITSGPLADFEAVFERRLSAAGRVRVLLQILQRWTAVEIEAAALRKERESSIVR
jgi:transcriptional antiterminator RfaH